MGLFACRVAASSNKALHLTAKSAVPLRYTLLLAASELGRWTDLLEAGETNEKIFSNRINCSGNDYPDDIFDRICVL